MSPPSTPDADEPADEPPGLLVVNDVETAIDDPERLARLAGAVRRRRETHPIVLDAGDSTAMGALAFTTETGRGHADTFHERVAFDVHVPGNHDFDHGVEWLREFAAGTPGRWVAANVPGLPDAETVAVGGHRVGVIGAVHPETPRICAAVSDLPVGDPVPAVREAAADLRGEGVDQLVVLSHCGPGDERIARETGVDAVLGGHDHERVVREVGDTLVARTAGRGHELLAVDPGDRPAARVVETAGEPRDWAIEAEYRRRHEAAALAEDLATLDSRLSVLETASFVADAYRTRAGTAGRGEGPVDAGLVAEASVREPLPAAVTAGDVVGAVPFGSRLVTVALPGDALGKALAATSGRQDATHGGVIWAGADPAGGTIGGEAPDPESTYEVGMMSYAAQVAFLPGIREDRVVADAGPQHEHVLAHARNGGLDAVAGDRTSNQG